jgi:hypothetical protein
MDFADRLDMMDDDCDIEGFPLKSICDGNSGRRHIKIINPIDIVKEYGSDMKSVCSTFLYLEKQGIMKSCLAIPCPKCAANLLNCDSISEIPDTVSCKHCNWTGNGNEHAIILFKDVVVG